ncbi:MAG TPA: amino acid ABC transporter substrate-binding protein [Candidatus Binataceae bacterium]|nr:amino acid ABC transporter substrate-binding protein [Candidatus Binataceae bacterium]
MVGVLLRFIRTCGFVMVVMGASTALSAEPIRIGCSVALTGGFAAIGKQLMVAYQIWRDDVNAKGGLLGRPVELLCYDDQSNPSNAPSIYTKLIDLDKVDLIVGPYGTNIVAAALPVIMQHQMTTIGLLANAANSQFHYQRYFAMIPSGPEPKKSFSTGFLELARAQNPRPQTIALIGADGEFSQNALDGARANVKEMGFTVVHDRNYPPSTTDFAPIIRAVKATNPDILYVAATPPDSVGIARAADEIGLNVKMFGGSLLGLIVTAVKVQLGPALNGIVNVETFLPAPKFIFPGTRELLDKYAAIAPGQGLDPLGYSFPPFAYAAGQVLAAAVTATNSLDHEKIAAYIHANTFNTVIGEVTFGKDGEWAKERTVAVQYRDVLPNNLDQFRDTAHEPILWPPEFKSGDIIYPYSEARKKH